MMQSACIVSEHVRWTLGPGLALRIVDRKSQKGGVLWPAEQVDLAE